MSFQLSFTEAQRVVAVLEEGIEKLAVLQTLTPDILAHREELAEVVGEEISRIIDEQRALEIKYEQLIAARSQLKGLSNKIKFVETQRAIEAVAKELRESTKILVRNLRDNPNIAENLLKIQRGRDELRTLLEQTMRDLRDCQYSTLHQTVEDARATQRSQKQLQRREEDATQEVERLQSEIAAERVLREEEAAAREKEAAALREELAQLRTRAKVDTSAMRRQAAARVDAPRRVHAVAERELEEEIKLLKKKIEIEQIVSAENEGFLKRKHDRMQQEIQTWMQKYDHDIEAKDKELQHLKGMRQNDLVRLRDATDEFRDLSASYESAVQKMRSRLEEEKLMAVQTKAIVKIQSAWRGHTTRHPPKRRKKKGKAKKKAKPAATPRADEQAVLDAAAMEAMQLDTDGGGSEFGDSGAGTPVPEPASGLTPTPSDL